MRSTILAVTGGKGGVGKTTVAYNLAAELDAVAVDADLGMADLPTSAGKGWGRGPDLHDVLAGRATAIEAVRETTPVKCLPCGRSLAGARGTEPRELVGAVESVAAEYGQVVIDCPAGMSGDVGLALHAADVCVLVTMAEPAALSDAVRARALARELDTGLAQVVVNRAETTPPTERIKRELGAPVTTIPESPVLAEAQADGLPVMQYAPEATAAEQIRSLSCAVRENLCTTRTVSQP